MSQCKSPSFESHCNQHFVQHLPYFLDKLHFCQPYSASSKVFFALALSCRPGTWEIQPRSMTELARIAGVTRRMAYHGLEAIVDAGLFDKVAGKIIPPDDEPKGETPDERNDGTTEYPPPR